MTPRRCQVRERDLPVVIHTLAGEFDIYREENGESIPVPCDDASNGFLKPKSGEWHRDVPEATSSPGGTVHKGCSVADIPALWGPLRFWHPAVPRGTLLAPVATWWHCGAVPKGTGDSWWLCPAAPSPTLHPVQSPQNRFCILTVAPDTLPAIATMLIDVLFYSHRSVTGLGTPASPLVPHSLVPFSSSGCILLTFCHPWVLLVLLPPLWTGALVPPYRGTSRALQPRKAKEKRAFCKRGGHPPPANSSAQVCQPCSHLEAPLGDTEMPLWHLWSRPNGTLVPFPDWRSLCHPLPAAPPRNPVPVTSTPSPSSPSRSSRATSPS